MNSTKSARLRTVLLLLFRRVEVIGAEAVLGPYGTAENWFFDLGSPPETHFGDESLHGVVVVGITFFVVTRTVVGFGVVTFRVVFIAVVTR